MPRSLNPYGRCRPVEKPYETWRSIDGLWEWRVLKKTDYKEGHSIWECAVKSPDTFGGWEIGSVNEYEVTQNGKMVQWDTDVDPFYDVRPRDFINMVDIPDTILAPCPLPPDQYSFLYDYFIANEGQLLHILEPAGLLSFVMRFEVNDVPTILTSDWTSSYRVTDDDRFQLNIIIQDQPDDPLFVPFEFLPSSLEDRLEVIRLVEQTQVTFRMVSVMNNNLHFVQYRNMSLPIAYRAEMIPSIHGLLRKVKADVSSF